MVTKSGDVYLNTLCLAVYAPGKETKKLMQAVVRMFDEVAKSDKAIITPVNVLYVKILKDILSGDIDLSNKSEMSAMMLKFANETAVKADRTLLPEITRLLSTEEAVSKRRIDTLWKNVKTHVVWTRCDAGLRKLLGISMKAASADEMTRELILQDLIDGIQSTSNEVRDTSDLEDIDDSTKPIDVIDFSDTSSILAGVRANHKKRQAQVIKFGLQSLNKMFGPLNGAPYGAFHAIAARSGHYKSGRLLDITRWICCYNKPPETNGKVPVVMFFSLENEIHENLMQWYRTAYANIYQRDPDGMSDQDIVEYCAKEFSKNGFRLHVVRRMGDDFGFNELVTYVEEFEAQNTAKVVALGLDYITLMKRSPEDKHLNEPRQIQNLGERCHNWCTHRDTYFYTGLQLETEAAKLANSGITNIVKRFNEAHLADCKGIKRELDILWFQEIEANHHGVQYVTVASNKQRYDVVPAGDKYAAHRFTPFGIMDDIMSGKDSGSKDIFTENDIPEDNSISRATQSVDMF